MCKHFLLNFVRNHSMIESQTHNCTIIRAEWHHCRVARILMCFSSLFLLLVLSFNRFGNVDHQNMFSVNMRYQFMFLVVHFVFFLFCYSLLCVESFCLCLPQRQIWNGIFDLCTTHSVVRSFIAHIANQ